MSLSLYQLAQRAPWFVLGAVAAAVMLDAIYDARLRRERRLDYLQHAIDDLERRASEAGA